MLKIAGIVFVVLASWGYGSGLIRQVRLHRDNLFACRELLDLLLGEIKYGKTPLGEAFQMIAQRLKEPFNSTLQQIAKELSGKQYESLLEIWNRCFQEKQKELLFTEEEMRILYGIGKNLGYLDTDMQMRHLTLYQKQVDGFLEQMEQTVKEKTKLYRSLSLMVGAMVILLLV